MLEAGSDLYSKAWPFGVTSVERLSRLTGSRFDKLSMTTCMTRFRVSAWELTSRSAELCIRAPCNSVAEPIALHLLATNQLSSKTTPPWEIPDTSFNNSRPDNILGRTKADIRATLFLTK